MRNVFVAHVELFAAKTANAEMDLFAKIEFVKLVAEPTIPVQKLNLASTNNAQIRVQFLDNAAHVLTAVFTITVFSAVARKEWLEIQ